MAKEGYLNDYRIFLQYFDETLDPNDPLPVKLASYRLSKKEVVGAIFNWTNQYLSDKKCPWHLISFLSRIVIERTRKRCKKLTVQCGFNPNDNVYEPLKLMQTVIEVINEVCIHFKSNLNVQNGQLAVSYTLPAPEAHLYCVVSMSSLKNVRRKMEDRFIVIHDLNKIFTKQDTTPAHYYAVFDGHDGEHAAVYSNNHLHQYLVESTNFISNPEQAIKDAFCKTDSMFIKKCETENLHGGTTAVCALLLPKEKTLYIAWVGDSQASVMSEGSILPCVVPHKPERQDERQRIEKGGGMIVHWGVWRVNGQLGVSRAIGDPEYKPYVTAIPEIVKIPLGGKEDFLVLGSDGLWDHVSYIEISDFIYDAVHAYPEKAQSISGDLVQLARKQGSSDNISVIVVFLKDPHQIAAGPKWNSRLVTMDTLDNANNPFAIPNKTNNVDRITTQTEEGLLLDFDDELKKTDGLPNNDLIKMLEKSNCDRLTPDFDKEDNLGPETNVDNPDDEPSSPNFETLKRHTEALNNNQNCNPFNDFEKSLELNLNLKAGTFGGLTSPTEEECIPSANSDQNESQLIDAGAESESEEDEDWNYVRGEEANKENIKSLQLNSQVAEEAEDLDDAMSQLNPNAAEFIPSPARNVASPLGRILDEDKVLSSSPKKPPPGEVDINVPNLCEFEKDISQKPHEIEEAFSNGHQDGFNNGTSEINAINSRLDEFHFGPNAAPFTPAKLDQSEVSSTRANFGDESEMTLDTSFNDSVFSQVQDDFVQKDDPMSMSFHQDRPDDANLFDLNKVHILPENVDEFIAKRDDSNPLFDDTISDLLTEHFPLGKPEEKTEQTEKEFTTDLDQEDKHVDDPHINQQSSSTPKDYRSQSPSEIEIAVESDRVLSPREEDNSPTEDSHESIIEECKMQDVEEHLSTLVKEQRLESPFEQSEISSPLEDEHSSLPSNEQKSPYEEKEMYSTHEEKDVCSPVEEKNVCSLIQKDNDQEYEGKEIYEDEFLLYKEDINEKNDLIDDQGSLAEKEVTEEKDTFNEKEINVLDENRKILSPIEPISSPDSTNVVVFPDQTQQNITPFEENNVCPAEETEVVQSISAAATNEIISIESPLQYEEITSRSQIDKDTSFSQDNIQVPSVQESPIEEKETILSSQEECSLVRETVESPSLEQEVSTAEIDEDNFSSVKPSESIEEAVDEPCKETKTCDNFQSPMQVVETLAEPQTTLKDEDFLQLEIEKSDEEKAKENLGNLLQIEESNAVSSHEKDNEIPDESVNISNISKSNLLSETTVSAMETNESQASLLEQEVSCLKPTEISTSSVMKEEKSLDIPQSTPIKLSQPKSLSANKITKTNEVEKKPIAKTKATASTAAKKASPASKPNSAPLTSKPTSALSTNRATLASSKTASKPIPKPASKTVSTTATTASQRTKNLSSKTESSTSMTSVKKTATTTTARAPTTTSNRVPLSVRSTTSTSARAIDTTKPSTGAIRKATDVRSSARTTGTSKVPLTAKTSKITATTTTAPKPRPNNLKPASSRTVDTSKPTAAKPATVPRVSLTSRTASTNTSSFSTSKNVKDTKPISVTDKQIKETANKLTAASRAIGTINSVSKTTTVTKKSETSITKTTNRTTTLNSKAPTKKSSEVTKTATTKVSKPKQNGVAPVVAEKIIVNDAPKEVTTGNTNGGEQFVKDNSPVDNKLITDELCESAAN